MFKLFNKEPKPPFEELKDVFVAVGKGFILRNALIKNGAGIDDLDEAFAFFQAVPEAIAGAKNIKFEDLTEEQIDELIVIVVNEWKVPDSEKVRNAMPYLVTGILNTGKGFDMLV